VTSCPVPLQKGLPPQRTLTVGTREEHEEDNIFLEARTSCLTNGSHFSWPGSERSSPSLLRQISTSSSRHDKTLSKLLDLDLVLAVFVFELFSVFDSSCSNFAGWWRLRDSRR